jgi:hypothetical protein
MVRRNNRYYLGHIQKLGFENTHIIEYYSPEKTVQNVPEC